MSTATQTAPAKKEIRIVSHSSLFYWWPVWAVGFLMALVSLFSDRYMAIVPEGATFREGVEIKIGDAKEARTVLVIPEKKESALDRDKNGKPFDPHMLVARSKDPGVVFCIVLLLVVTITNIPLRGLWSVIVITVIISITIILAILQKWHDILEAFGRMDIRINFGGYFLISVVLLVLWVVVFVFFDKQIYMVFTPGQLRLRLEIGDAETAYDTTGMTIQKQRSDLFRHWILGLGSGDLIVKTAGAQSHHFDMPNVLFLGRKVKEIEEMLRSRTVVAGQP